MPVAVTIIVLNYRTCDVTLACLRSVHAVHAEVEHLSVVVVDNASGDGSAERLRQEMQAQGWDRWMSLIVSEQNLGFAGGNNLGIRHAMRQPDPSDYVLLLNSDTLVHPGALAHSLRVMEAEPQVGLMSCCLLNADGTVQNVIRRFPHPLMMTVCALGLPWRWPRLFGWANCNDTSDALLQQKGDWDWIGGAFMFIRRTALDAVGLLDEDFFFYGEDIEFCWRFHKAGWRVHYDPGASIAHLGGGSSDPSRLPSDFKSRQQWRARYLVQRKCYGAWAERWLRGVDRGILLLQKAKARFRQGRDSMEYARLSQSLRSIASDEVRA